MKNLAAYGGVLICGVAIGYGVAVSFQEKTDATAAAGAPPAVVAEEAPAARPAATAAPSGVRLERRREFARVDLAEPDLHARLKPVLNRGTNMEMAAADFTSAVDFAAVAHAARDTGIPFMVLKHQMVTEGKSLEAAIRASKPDAHADIEADLALAKAEADLAAVARD